MVRPRPVPSYLRVEEPSTCWKRLKMLGRCSAGMPMPVSRTSSQCLPTDGAYAQGDRPGIGELDGIADQVGENPLQLLVVQVDRGHLPVPHVMHLQALALDHVLKSRGDVPSQLVQVRIPQPQLHLAGLEFREIQHLVDHVQQLQAVDVDLPDQPLVLGLQRPDVALVQALHRGHDRGEGSAHLVADVGEELRLEHVQLLQLLVGLGQVVAPAELLEAHLVGQVGADVHQHDRSHKEEVIHDENREVRHSPQKKWWEQIGTVYDSGDDDRADQGQRHDRIENDEDNDDPGVVRAGRVAGQVDHQTMERVQIRYSAIPISRMWRWPNPTRVSRLMMKLGKITPSRMSKQRQKVLAVNQVVQNGE